MIKKLNNEKGVALITALLVLAVLTLLGLAATLVSSTDLEIARNEKLAMQGQYAAEAGIAQALVMLNYSTSAGDRITEPVPSATWSMTADAATESWEQPITGTISDGLGSFFTYSTVVAYKKTAIGSYYGRVAFFNTTAGFSTAPSGTGGWPVFEIVSYARRGEYRTQYNILELTLNVKNFQVNGGFTAGGNVTLNGNPTIDGQHHDANGTAVATGNDCRSAGLSQPMPAIFSNGTTQQSGSVTLAASPEIADPTETSVSIPATPWEAIWGPPDTTAEALAEFNNLFPSGPVCWGGGAGCSTDLTGDNYYSSFGLNQNITGSGMLVIHNPSFVSGACTCPAGGADCWSAANEALDADCAAANTPAVLDANTGTFRGIIVADAISLRGNVTIIGAVVSLSSLQTTATGAGNPAILYSCQAIEQFAGGLINKKLNWRKQSSPPL